MDGEIFAIFLSIFFVFTITIFVIALVKQVRRYGEVENSEGDKFSEEKADDSIKEDARLAAIQHTWLQPNRLTEFIDSKEIETETPTPSQGADDSREALKREIQEELRGKEPPKKERKAPVLAIVACCLIGVYILGMLGSTLELTGGKFNAGVMGYTIGALSWVIAALVLMIIDTVKRTK